MFNVDEKSRNLIKCFEKEKISFEDRQVKSWQIILKDCPVPITADFIILIDTEKKATQADIIVINEKIIDLLIRLKKKTNTSYIFDVHSRQSLRKDLFSEDIFNLAIENAFSLNDWIKRLQDEEPENDDAGSSRSPEKVSGRVFFQ